MAHAEQAAEHDDEQDKVGNKYGHEGCCIAAGQVVEAAAGNRRIPKRADLRVDKYERSEIYSTEIDASHT
jgi:uncharacterized protein YycO